MWRKLSRDSRERWEEAARQGDTRPSEGRYGMLMEEREGNGETSSSLSDGKGAPQLTGKKGGREKPAAGRGAAKRRCGNMVYFHYLHTGRDGVPFISTEMRRDARCPLCGFNYVRSSTTFLVLPSSISRQLPNPPPFLFTHLSSSSLVAPLFSLTRF